MNRIYMDNAATTAIRPEVLEAMTPYLTSIYGNASSVHSFGREARSAIDAAREQVAKALGAKAQEIYFTSGGTEADNWALKGVVAAYGKPAHIITSSVEHHAVLHTAETLEKQGVEVTYLKVDEDGLVDPKDVEAAIKDNTALVSIMYANNEIGTIQPISEIAKICLAHKIPLHTDAVQAVGHMPIDLSKEPGISMLSLSGHKLHGPKGVGALYIRKGVKIKPFMEGGAHERHKRAGTENTAGIVGLGKAMELAARDMEEHTAKITAMRDKLIDGLLEAIPYSRLNGHRHKRLPGNVNISISYIEGESMLLNLDLEGIAASSGSACTSGSLDPSHVLLSIGLDHATAHGSLRLSLDYDNTMEECDSVIKILPPIVKRLREMSPLFSMAEGGLSFV
ncbi:MAG: cysteine desulfurase NifS [Christensenellales bacterium]